MTKILEIGSGQGFFSYVLSKNTANSVIGIDFSREDVLIARKRYSKVQYRVMNAQDLDFNNDNFDRVYALDILEHVDNLDLVLKEVKRVLKKRGKFIINIPYYKSEEWLLKIRPTYFKEIHHVRVFKYKELEKILLKYNFNLVKKEKKGFLQHIELYFLFTRKVNSKTQLSIGNWRDNNFTKIIHILILYFDPIVLETPLKYFPIWIITLPIGFILNNIGNRIFPKSIYYEFIKI